MIMMVLHLILGKAISDMGYVVGYFFLVMLLGMLLSLLCSFLVPWGYVANSVMMLLVMRLLSERQIFKLPRFELC